MKRLILSIFLLVTIGFAITPANLSANHGMVYTTRCDKGDISPYQPNGKEHPFNTVFTLIITPENGYKVQYIHLNGIPVAIPTPETNGNVIYQILISQDTTRIDVCFNDGTPRYKITATSGDNGVISSPGTIWYDSASTPCYTFSPDDGYEVDVVRVDGNPLTPPVPNPYCFSSLNADHTIDVTFKKLPDTFDLTITYKFLNEEGEEIPNGASYTTPGEGITRIVQGDNRTVNFFPESRWIVNAVVVNGVSQTLPLTSFPFNDVQQDNTLDITFKSDTISIKELKIPSLKVSPNPVNSIATITKDADVIFTSIEVVDIMGNLVITIDNPTNQIDFSALATGSYIVRFHTAKGFAIRSIVKK